MMRLVFFIFIAFGFPAHGQQDVSDTFRLVWADEFNQDGPPNPDYWSFEEGFKRNKEDQWYQKENAYCKDGVLVIEVRQEKKKNPTFRKGSNDWAASRRNIKYTSSSINTAGRKAWKYGRFEMRARIPIGTGLWPAFWTLGVEGEWPSNGEIDIMEYYRGNILANVATGTKERWKAAWYTSTKAVKELGGQRWADEFHTWRMDWDEDGIALYVDDSLMNRVPLSDLVNQDGSGINPFRQPHYILLNFALGGINGGKIDDSLLPARYEIDYVRVYQKQEHMLSKMRVDRGTGHVDAAASGPFTPSIF